MDGRTLRHAASDQQRIRKRIEEVFGWIKKPAGSQGEGARQDRVERFTSRIATTDQGEAERNTGDAGGCKEEKEKAKEEKEGGNR